MDEKKVRRYHRILIAILVLSFLLRAFLVLSGGQYFWPDEGRYQRSIRAADALWAGDIHGSLRALHSADHFLFKVIGVVPATMQIIIAPSPKIPALFFSLFSVASLWLMWGIMRITGENERVALFSVILLSFCTTFLYYCRHLLPYDAAMALGLFSLFVGIRIPTRAVDSILCGFFSACAFLTYNGYWVLAGFAMLTHTLRPPLKFDHCARRGFISGVSFAVPVVALLALSHAVGGNLLQKFIHFSRTVTQGSYSEGWSFPFFYLWHSEHFLILLWAFALIFSLWQFARRRRKVAMIFGLSGILVIYGLLVIFSVVLEQFVVYGRLVRQLVPFCCILAALFLEQLWTSAPKGKSIVIVILVIAAFQTAVNFQQPFTQVFPSEFRRLASEASLSTDTGKYEVHFAHHIFPIEYYYPASEASISHPPCEYDMLYTNCSETLAAKEAGKTIIQRHHPLQFIPYQYEGYTPDQRSKIRSRDISMKLILKAK